MNASGEQSRRVASLSLWVTLPLLCATSAGAISGRMGGGMGFDHLANFLGGLGIGALAGLLLAWALGRTASPGALKATASAALLLVIVLVVYVFVAVQRQTSG